MQTVPHVAQRLAGFWKNLEEYTRNGEPADKAYFSQAAFEERLASASLERSAFSKDVRRGGVFSIKAKWQSDWKLRSLPDLSRPGGSSRSLRSLPFSSVFSCSSVASTTNSYRPPPPLSIVLGDFPTAGDVVAQRSESAERTASGGSIERIFTTIEEASIEFSPITCLPIKYNVVVNDLAIWNEAHAAMKKHAEAVRLTSEDARIRVIAAGGKNRPARAPPAGSWTGNKPSPASASPSSSPSPPPSPSTAGKVTGGSQAPPPPPPPKREKAKMTWPSAKPPPAKPASPFPAPPKPNSAARAPSDRPSRGKRTGQAKFAPPITGRGFKPSGKAAAAKEEL